MNDRNDTSEIIDIEPDRIIEPVSENEDVKPSRKRVNANFRQYGATAVLVALSVVGGGWLYREVLAGYLPSSQVQELTSRIELLEANGKTISGKLDAVVGLTDEIKSQLAAAFAAAQNAEKLASGLQVESANTKSTVAALKLALTKSNDTLDELKSAMSKGAPIAGNAGSAALVARLETLEKQAAGVTQKNTTSKSGGAELSQSLSNLKAKIYIGATFDNEFQKIKKLVPTADGLDVLQKSAAQGLPSAQTLGAELKVMSTSLRQPTLIPAAPENSWWGSVSNMMSGVVTIRDAEGTDWSQIASQSAELAEQGDLTKALAMLGETRGELPAVLQNWRDRVVARLELEKAVDKISSAILREIAAQG